MVIGVAQEGVAKHRQVYAAVWPSAGAMAALEQRRCRR